MDRRWLLLIYTIPSEPSRKRAYVWRELKKAGALYLRDGVAVLPDQPDALHIFQQIAARIEEFAGQAFLVQAAELDVGCAQQLITQSQAARRTEYHEVRQEMEQFLA